MSITNLSLPSKIIERSVKSRLTDHLFSHNFLTPHQSRAFYWRGNEADCLIDEPMGELFHLSDNNQIYELWLKNKLRTSLSDNTLSSLLILASEHDILQQLNNSDIIDQMAAASPSVKAHLLFWFTTDVDKRLASISVWHYLTYFMRMSVCCMFHWVELLS